MLTATTKVSFLISAFLILSFLSLPLLAQENEAVDQLETVTESAVEESTAEPEPDIPLFDIDPSEPGEELPTESDAIEIPQPAASAGELEKGGGGSLQKEDEEPVQDVRDTAVDPSEPVPAVDKEYQLVSLFAAGLVPGILLAGLLLDKLG